MIVFATAFTLIDVGRFLKESRYGRKPPIFAASCGRKKPSLAENFFDHFAAEDGCNFDAVVVFPG